jgi:hypothetical protein
MKTQKELLTMEEKMKLDPKELMENGLTREQNDRLEKQTSGVSFILSLVVIGMCCYSLYLLFSI